MLTVLTQGPPFLWVIEAACPVFRAGSCFEAKRFACAIENGNGNIQSSGAPQRPACRLAIAPSMRQSAPRQIPERQSVSLKRRRKIAVVGRLNREYGTPSIDCSSDAIDRYSCFANRYVGELCKGLQH
jgi:hypothetical protein